MKAKRLIFFEAIVCLALLAGAGVSPRFIDGQARAAPRLQAAVGDVVINEIMQNPAAVSDTNGEWFELYNATDADIDINGWTIQDLGTDSHVIDNDGPLVIPASGYLVLGRNGDPATNGGMAVDYVYSSFTLSNDDDEIILLDGDEVEVDRVEYDGAPHFPDPNGASMELIAPELDNNLGSNWQEASTPYGAGDLGTPGGPNGVPVVPTPTPTPPPVPSMAVVISEVAWAGTAASAADEWIELYNNTAEEVDLTGWTLTATDGAPSILLSGVIPAHGFFLLERSHDDQTVSDIPADQTYTDAMENNPSAEVLELRDANGNLIDTTNGNGGPWPEGTASPDYYSMERVDPTTPDDDSNWASNDGVTRNGLDANGNPLNGTPKMANSAWPRLSTILVSPTEVDVPVGRQQQFSATGYDQYGDELPVTPDWSTNAGSITAEGVLTAQAVPACGLWVRAAVGKVTGTATVNAMDTFYRDADGDGYGNSYVSMQACEAPVGYVVDNSDCDDTNPAVHPGAEEVLGNGMDDDCNPDTPDEAPQAELWAVQYRWGAPAPGYSFAGWPIFEGWMEVRIENRGTGNAFNVTATITGWPANTTVPDPDVAVGDIPTRSSAWSSGDTFTTRVDMAHPVDPCEGAIWRIEYDDAADVHHVIENVPEFPPGEGPCP